MEIDPSTGAVIDTEVKGGPQTASRDSKIFRDTEEGKTMNSGVTKAASHAGAGVASSLPHKQLHGTHMSETGGTESHEPTAPEAPGEMANTKSGSFSGTEEGTKQL